MDISCPHCDFSRSISPDKVPDRPVKVTCPKCSQGFSFNKSELSQKSVESGQQPTTGEQIACPACGLNQPKADSCNGCGVVYSRLQARQKQNNAANTADNSLAAVRQSTAEPAPQLAPKAGFWVRVVAYLLDSCLLGAVQFALGLLLGVFIALMNGSADNTAMTTVLWLFGAVISIAYAIFFTGYCGQTPGKMALRIKVIRTDGSNISYGRAALREIPGKFISGILLCVGYIMVAFDSQKQGLHDKMADTYVIKL